MNAKIENQKLLPPKLIPTILAGFNTVANHLGLILFPLGLDLLFWFGPQLKLEKVLKPIYASAIQTLIALNKPEMKSVLTTTQTEIDNILNRINLTNFLSTFPLGVPSLLSGQGIKQTPLGAPAIIELPSVGIIFLVSVLFILIGLLFGSLYMSVIAQSTTNNKSSIKTTGKNVLNGVGLAFVLVIIFLVMSLPLLFIVSLISLFSPAISQIILIISTFILLWLLIPLVFAPHGIFAKNMGIYQSIRQSVKVVRSYMPGTGMFLLVAILLAQGLDILWIVAPSQSWLTLVGITGHAFIYTALIASSFIYYQKSGEWVSNLLERINQLNQNKSV